MAEQILSHKCPNCTAPLRFDGSAGKLVCDYCESTFEVAEAEAMFKEQEARAAEARQANAESAWNTTAFSEDWGSDAAGMKSYSCPSCGAELICDETTAASCCPYCGNQTVVPGQFAGALKPEYIIPFKTDKEAAVLALKNHYKGKALLPKAFVNGNHIDDIQGVYVPFWLYDCEAVGRMRFSAEKHQDKHTPNEKIVITEHYTLLRDGKMSFEKVPADASKRMPDEHMDSIEPFDYGDLKEFSTAYMPGFLADKYDEDAEVCGKRMEERCRASLESGLRNSVSGFENVKEIEKNIVVKKGAVHYAMLPVWLLSTNWNGKNFLFAMNGQSGKLIGDLPLDKGKYWGFLCGIAGGLIAIMTALNFLLLHWQTLLYVIVGIILPIIIGLIVVSVMKSKLKSVRTGSADKYSKNGLDMRVNEDVFIRATVKRTPKQ